MAEAMTRVVRMPCARGTVAAMMAGGGDSGVEGERDPIVLDAAKALDRLMAGNERFAEQRVAPRHDDARRLSELTAGQAPFATILGCSDSRIPPELVFDQGFGDLFVVRVAGNVMNAHVMGSIEFAMANLGTPLVVVLGHEDCGAVTAALGSKAARDRQPVGIRMIIRAIVPAIAEIDPSLDARRRLEQAVEANVRWTMRRIAGSGWLARSLPDVRAVVVGAVVRLELGRVRLLD